MQGLSKSQENRLKELTEIRLRCDEDLLFFTRYYFKILYNKRFIVNPHHRIICDYLNRIISGEIKRLIINIAPRMGKTELAVINFIAKGIGYNPESKFIHLSYSDDLVLDNSERIRDIINLPEFNDIFPDVQIKVDSRAKKNWKTTKRGGMYAVATGGQVTGFGAGLVDNVDFLSAFMEEFSDYFVDEYIDRVTGEIQTYGGALVVDDPIKPEDAKSDLLREAVNKRFDSTISNRVNSRNTPMVLIGQRTAPYDLSGHLLGQQGSDWLHLNLPAVLTPEDMDKVFGYVDDYSTHQEGRLRDIYKYEYDRKIYDIMRVASKLKKSSKEYEKSAIVVDIIEKQKLELDKRDIEFPLWRFKHRLDELYRERDKDHVYFATQYMQDPRPAEGLMYPYEWLTYSELPKCDIVRAYTDVADEGSDYLCSIVYGELLGKKYVIDIVYTQSPTEVTENSVANMLDRCMVSESVFESNNGGKAFARAVEKICRANGNYKTTISWFYQTNNKDARIKNNSSTVQNTMVMPADWHIKWRKFHEHVTNYMLVGKNKYKDAADSLTGCIEAIPIGDKWATVH